MPPKTPLSQMFKLIPFAIAIALLPGCADDGDDGEHGTICTEGEQYDWWSVCQSESDCCVGDQPICTTTTFTGDSKVCTRECTIAPENSPMLNDCEVPAQTHGCGSGCCLINYIQPDDGSTTANWGIGCCVPSSE